jgi:hypothetical protein
MVDDLLDAVYECRPREDIVERLVKIGDTVFQATYPYLVVKTEEGER